MRPRISCLAVVVGAGALAAPAGAQLLTQKSLSAGMAIAIAQTALETCTKQGYHVSVHVLGRNGEGADKPGSWDEDKEGRFRELLDMAQYEVPGYDEAKSDEERLEALHRSVCLLLQGAVEAVDVGAGKPGPSVHRRDEGVDQPSRSGSVTASTSSCPASIVIASKVAASGQRATIA